MCHTGVYQLEREEGEKHKSSQYLGIQYDAGLPKPVILISRFIRKTGDPEDDPHGNRQQYGASSDLCLPANTCAPTGCMENCDYFDLQAPCFAMVLETTPNCGTDPSHLWAAD